MVLGPEIGLVIIEVKDWSVDRIRQANRYNFELVNGSDFKVLTNPEKQAEGHFRALSSQLAHYQQSDPEKYQSLLQTDGPHRGRLAVPISYLIAFPNVTRQAWQSSPLQLYHMINTERVLLKEDLAGDLTARLQAAPPFRARLSRSQLTTLKWMLYPESRVPYTQGALFTLDPDQLGLAQLDTYLPPQAQKLARKPGAKLVRGVVGSGKSLILLYRAKFLSELNPNWRVLILTYNKSLREYLRQGFGRIGGDPERVEIASFHQWCRSQLLAHDRFPTPQDRRSQLGLITRLLAETSNPTLEASFLADEFNWIKERLDYRRWADYLDPAKVKRVGRGRGLGRNEAEVRAEIYRLFELYQAELAKHHLGDWADVPVRVLQALDAGRLEPAQYHAVLIDEAQDFAPAWFRVAFRMVKPETNMLFIVGDGAQKIYGRDFTWKELGIGITAQNSYVLKRSYRSTREIIEVALEAIRTSQTLLEELRSAGDGLVEPERSEPDDPHGPLPVLLAFESPDQEQTGVTGQILSLLQQGYLPQQI
ncbi:MAG: ATP-dependent helicase, partial [Anaerolineae bacterium]|nr:ATP-dependent helicase [Anaerolineae bacterium]